MTVCVVLAAGRSSRMGTQKLLLPLAGSTMLARALEAAAGFPAIAVVAPALVHHVPARPGLRVVVNDAPERGMARSLALANELAEPHAALAVLLADTPLVDASLVRRIAEARGDADVAYPMRDGVPGHPVVFGPGVRAAIGTLPDGDTLRALRTDPRYSQVRVAVAGEAPYFDVDTPEAFARAAALLETPDAPA